MSQNTLVAPCNIGEYIDKMSFLRFGIKFEMNANIKLDRFKVTKKANEDYMYFKCPMPNCPAEIKFFKKSDTYQYQGGCFTHIHTTEKETKKFIIVFLKIIFN